MGIRGRIMAVDALVAERIGDQRLARIVDIAFELRLDALERFFQRRIGWRIPGRRALQRVRQRRDALAAQRVTQREWNDIGIAVAELLNLELLERSEEHTSELHLLMSISSAVFCLKKKNTEYKLKN